jgi:hypothetical protein
MVRVLVVQVVPFQTRSVVMAPCWSRSMQAMYFVVICHYPARRKDRLDEDRVFDHSRGRMSCRVISPVEVGASPQQGSAL